MKKKQAIALLLATLKQWPCPNCGGRGTYRAGNRTCRGCDGTGYHPLAREAIEIVEEAFP